MYNRTLKYFLPYLHLFILQKITVYIDNWCFASKKQSADDDFDFNFNKKHSSTEFFFKHNLQTGERGEFLVYPSLN